MASYPGGFSLVKDEGDTEFIQLTTAGIAVTVGDCLELTAGSVNWAAVTAASANWTFKAIAQETVAAAATTLRAIFVTVNQTWVSETANASAAADNGDTMLFTDANTINNTGANDVTVSACFVQFQPSGAAADNRIIGKFVGLFGKNINI